MTRILLNYLLPFLAPLVVYVAYMWWFRRQTLAAGGTPPRWHEGPWYWFVLAGFLLVLAGVIALGLTGIGERDVDYAPARLIDGRIVPGRPDG